MMPALAFAPANPHFNLELGAALVFFALVFVALVGAIVMLRRSVHEKNEISGETQDAAFRVNAENPSAFMAASMQGVITRLREQEQELARLHQLEKERAQETERLSEAVTRNMPAGLLLITATGTISSANPAAEKGRAAGAARCRR